jgi:hypothetical protein
MPLTCEVTERILNLNADRRWYWRCACKHNRWYLRALRLGTVCTGVDTGREMFKVWFCKWEREQSVQKMNAAVKEIQRVATK